MGPASRSAGRPWYSGGTASTDRTVPTGLRRGHTERQPAAPRTSGHGHPRTHDPMNALTLTLIRLAFLAVLWLFVIAAVGVVRTDLFGPALSGRQQRRHQKAQQKAPRASRPPRAGR